MATNRRKLIIIGAPVFRDVSPEVLQDWMAFAYHCGRRMPEYDFGTAIIPKKEQFRARNQMVEQARLANADYLLMLDDDMIINHGSDPGFIGTGTVDAYGFLDRLLKADKDIVGGLYFQRTGDCAAVAMMRVPESKGYRFMRDDELTGGLQKVDVVGGGCMLIKMSVFDRLPHPFFAPEFDLGTDVQLCKAAAEKGFGVWLDSGTELGHQSSERTVITSRNRMQRVAADNPGGPVPENLTSVFDQLVKDGEEYTGWDPAEMLLRGSRFMTQRNREDHLIANAKKDRPQGWYEAYPMERVARQVMFNARNANKRAMTELIVNSVAHSAPLDILDFGCGIGVPAFVLAQKGHRVYAVDLKNTGTIEFLKWRTKKHGASVKVGQYSGHEPDLSLGLEGLQFDVIIAMDCLEHITDWRNILGTLSAHLRPGGALFANNAILDDKLHPEHVDCEPRDFVAHCAELGLMPVNQLVYVKKPADPARYTTRVEASVSA